MNHLPHSNDCGISTARGLFCGAVILWFAGCGGLKRESTVAGPAAGPPPATKASTNADRSGAALAKATVANEARQGKESLPTSPAPEASGEFLAGDSAATDAAPIDDTQEADMRMLQARAAEQQGTISRFRVFHDFRFEDRLDASDIHFRHTIVDDAGKFYKAVHYDHGSGLAAADVDQDGLVDLFFVSQAGANQLYRNLGNGRFTDITRQAGLTIGGKISVAASFADIDNDGDSDLYLTTVRGGNHLFENDGRGHFQDITESAGVGYVGHSSAAVFFDYDRDGLLDLFLCNVGKYTTDTLAPARSEQTDDPTTYYVGFKDAFAGHLKPERHESSILYRNAGQRRFLDVSKQVDLVDISWTGDATPIDANDDGWLDLYVLNMQGHDEYYENDRGRRFLRRSREVFRQTPWGSMGVKVFDFNHDGRLDLYVTDMHSDMAEAIGPENEKLKSAGMLLQPESLLRSDGQSIFGNAFFCKQGPNQFTEISDQIAAENYWPWGLSTGDLNADGFEDVFISASMNYPFRYGINSVLLNNRGETFLDSEFILGIEPRRGGRTHVPWFTCDCDGADRKHRACRGKTGKVTVSGALGTRSSVIFDLDRDGDLDIVTNDFNSEPMVLISNLSERASIRYVNVELVGSRSNRHGIGAIVAMTTSDGTLTQVQDGKSGYLSQSVLPLYFGLGPMASVEKIVIQWPSGTTQTLSAPVAVNETLVVTEPADPASGQQP